MKIIFDDLNGGSMEPHHFVCTHFVCRSILPLCLVYFVTMAFIYIENALLYLKREESAFNEFA